MKLPHLFGDHMVLQRGMPVSVWGWAGTGEKITVAIGGKSAATRAGEDGRWKLELPALEALGPCRMTVSGENEIILKDVLVGEVWFCSGQCNMEFPLRWVEHAREEVEAADHPEIRLFKVPKRTSGRPAEDVEARWFPCKPRHAFGFSAVAYFFGRELNRKLGVPVGLIQASRELTRIEPWIPVEGFAAVPKLRHVLKELQSLHREYRSALDEALPSFAAWTREARRALEEGGPLRPPPPCPRHPLEDPGRPVGLYNGMVHPLTSFVVRGAIWYQGEQNVGDGAGYGDRMKALILGWRKAWGRDDLPFYFVQLTPYRYGRNRPTEKPAVDPSPYRLPAIWEAQRSVLSLPNTGMAVTTDLGDLDNLHPRNKEEVGRRLALWALARTYGMTDLVCSGPLFRFMTVEGRRIRIHFDHVGSGLAARDGGALTWFETAGKEMRFLRAEAVIDGNTVLVWNDEIPEPVAVRFGWHQEARPNLVNKEGLPASPFSVAREASRNPGCGFAPARREGDR